MLYYNIGGSPFGVILKSREFTSNQYRYGFNGMEKDDEVKGAGNCYTTLYRFFDSRLGRWLSLDPYYFDLPWEAPYIVHGNNPISRVDQFGNKWKTEADKANAQETKTELETKRTELTTKKTDLTTQVTEKQAQLDNFKLGIFHRKERIQEREALKTDIYNLNNEIKDLDSRISSLNSSLDELEVMGSDATEQVFTFSEITDASRTYGVTHMNEEGEIVIEYSGTANKIHELTHAYQHITGDVEFIKGTGKADFSDLHDELVAYKRQYAYDPQSVIEITSGAVDGKDLKITNMSSIQVYWVMNIYYQAPTILLKDTNGNVQFEYTPAREYLYQGLGSAKQSKK